jgi:hypothetical protein
VEEEVEEAVEEDGAAQAVRVECPAASPLSIATT